MDERGKRVVNLGTIHDEIARVDPERIAIIHQFVDESITYGDLAEAVAKTANALSEIGIQRGDRVAISLPNSMSYLYTVFGAMRIGAVPVPVNFRLTQSSVNHIIKDSAPVAIVTGADTAAISTMQTAFETVGTSLNTICVVGDHADTDFSDIDSVALDKVRQRQSGSAPACSVEFETPALQPYTSGSTGKPKGVVLTHGGAFWNNRIFQQINFVDETERVMTMTPLYHKNAMMNIKSAIIGGGSVVIIADFDPETALAAIECHDVTFLTGVPAIYELLVRSTALDDYDVSSIAAAGCGSDNVPERLYSTFQSAFDAPILEGYGLTEGGPMVTSSPRWGVRRKGAAGLALPGVDTRIVDPDSREEVPTGEKGELIVASPGVASYHNRPDLADRFEAREGKRFISTGDLARKDSDGFHFIIGRIDSMFIVGGENVYPAEIESLLETHPAVDQAAVVPVPHEFKGSAPVAFVVPNTEISEKELISYYLDRGPAYSHPRRVFLVNSFPLTSTDKLDRTILEEEAHKRVGGSLS